MYDIRLKPKQKKVQGPVVTVHYVYAVPLRRAARSHAFWASGVFLLLLGVGIGGASVWYSQFSEANRQSRQAAINEIGGIIEVPELAVIPLEFDSAELEVVTTMLPLLIEENRHEPTPEELRNQERKDKLRAYFTKRKSPFGNDDQTINAFLDSRNMKLMIAISFVESTMGKNCYYYNCSGLGGYPPNLRKYSGYHEWVKDFDDLLERRYKGVPIEKFLGLYVQPGSPNWLAGVKQILAELKAAGIE